MAKHEHICVYQDGLAFNSLKWEAKKRNIVMTLWRGRDAAGGECWWIVPTPEGPHGAAQLVATCGPDGTIAPVGVEDAE